MGAGFLDQLATQLRINKTAPCRRAIQRFLEVVKKEYERGKYGSTPKPKTTSDVW
jgi:hypothetical protein